MKDVETITLTVPGKPVPKGRPRFARGHTYTPVKTRDYETLMAIKAKEAMRGRKPFEGALVLILKVFRNIPVSFGKKKTVAAEARKILPITKSDLDNHIKTIDALNKICFNDDSQIVTIIASKYYSTNPRMEIEIKQCNTIF